MDFEHISCASRASQSVNVNDDNADIDDLKLRNDPSESNVENLINLPYLHEPAILFCLQVPELFCTYSLTQKCSLTYIFMYMHTYMKSL